MRCKAARTSAITAAAARERAPDRRLAAGQRVEPAFGLADLALRSTSTLCTRSSSAVASFARSVRIDATSDFDFAALLLQMPRACPACRAVRPATAQRVVSIAIRVIYICSTHTYCYADNALSGRRLELRGMEETLQASQEQRAKIEAEVAAIGADRAKLAAALVDLAQTIDDRQQKIAGAEARLDELTGSEEAIRRSLDSRRAVIVENSRRLAADGPQAAAGPPGGAGRHARRDPHLDDAGFGAAGDARRHRGAGRRSFRSCGVAPLDRRGARFARGRGCQSSASTASASRP